jgi:hypothetical protein
VVAPLIPVAGSIAIRVVVPTATKVANPFDPAALLIVAVAVLDELHATDVVRFCVVPSVYVLVAVNSLVVPSTMDGLVGVTEMAVSVACDVLLPPPPPQPEITKETSSANIRIATLLPYSLIQSPPLDNILISQNNARVKPIKNKM